MGEVFLADDTPLNRKVALKFLPVAILQIESALTIDPCRQPCPEELRGAGFHSQAGARGLQIEQAWLS